MLGLWLGLGCRSADAQREAQPRATRALTSGLAPAGWSAAPGIAEAATSALDDVDAVEGTEAWAEPAMGCYAVWFAYRRDGVASAIAERVVASFGAHGITTTDVRAPATGTGARAIAPLELRFARPAPVTGSAGSTERAGIDGLPAAYTGRLRARLGTGRIELLACFASEREPGACEAACTTLFGGFQ